MRDVILRRAYAPVATGPCNCCSCRFGHPHPCVSDIGRYPLMTWLATSAGGNYYNARYEAR